MTPIQLDLDWRKTLLLDLKVQPSDLFIEPPKKVEGGEGDGGEGEGDGEAEGEPAEPVEVLDLKWHCKKGLAMNI